MPREENAELGAPRSAPPVIEKEYHKDIKL